MTNDVNSLWLSSLDGQPRHAAPSPGNGTHERGPSADSAPAVPAFRPPAPFGWTDALTDTDGPRMWDRMIAMEEARNARHHRTSTVAIFDVEGFDPAVERWGQTIALQHFIELARALASEIRTSDCLARIGATRFGVLLTETDEISAINFVDRVGERCAAGGSRNGLRLISGWASAEPGGRLADAMLVAETRLVDARLREG